MTDVIAEIATGVCPLDAAQWDGLNASGNPFVGHPFLCALEQSGSIGPGTGWSAAPIAIRDDAGALAGALPAYLKTHSQGEYVFDHGWADAYERAGAIILNCRLLHLSRRFRGRAFWRWMKGLPGNCCKLPKTSCSKMVCLRPMQLSLMKRSCRCFGTRAG